MRSRVNSSRDCRVDERPPQLQTKQNFETSEFSLTRCCNFTKQADDQGGRNLPFPPPPPRLPGKRIGSQTNETDFFIRRVRFTTCVLPIPRDAFEKKLVLVLGSQGSHYSDSRNVSYDARSTFVKAFLQAAGVAFTSSCESRRYRKYVGPVEFEKIYGYKNWKVRRIRLVLLYLYVTSFKIILVACKNTHLK